jgi:Na+/H+ antiporter NhaD/arsenite permease-like protein
MVTLLGLIIAATGIKRSNYLDRAAFAVVGYIKNERSLAFFMCALSISLSMFLTNDITLFIVVPLTVCMKKILKNDIVKLVIMEAIAVNVGSALTPIGNPQNIFIWSSWGITAVRFVSFMLLPVLIMSAGLAGYILFFFKPEKLDFHECPKKEKTDKTLGVISALLMAVFLVTIRFNAAVYALPLIIAVYLIFYRDVLKDVDWMLLLTFVLMFIDFSLIARIPAVKGALAGADMSNPRNVFLLSSILSQLMSNVPAAIFVSKFSSNWLMIAYGVNLAGNGTIIASLANLIAIRLLGQKDNRGTLLRFHVYSIPYFILTTMAMLPFIK